MKEVVVYDSIVKTNLPPRQKSAVLSFLQQHMSPAQLKTVGSHTLSKLRASHPQQGMIRQQGESLLFGGAYALANGALGGLDLGSKKNMPLEAGVAAVSLVGAAVLSSRGSGLATEANNLAASSLTLLAFRKTSAVLGLATSTVKSVTSKISGEEEDSILAAAKEL